MSDEIRSQRLTSFSCSMGTEIDSHWNIALYLPEAIQAAFVLNVCNVPTFALFSLSLSPLYFLHMTYLCFARFLKLCICVCVCAQGVGVRAAVVSVAHATRRHIGSQPPRR